MKIFKRIMLAIALFVGFMVWHFIDKPIYNLLGGVIGLGIIWSFVSTAITGIYIWAILYLAASRLLP